MIRVIRHRRRKRTMGYAGRIALLFFILALVILSGCSCRDIGYYPYRAFPNSTEF